MHRLRHASLFLLYIVIRLNNYLMRQEKPLTLIIGGYGRIHVNLNKSGVDLASRVTIFNTVVFVLTNQNDISGVTGLYASHIFLAVKCKK